MEKSLIVGWLHILKRFNWFKAMAELNPPLAGFQCAEKPRSPFAKGESRHSAFRTGTKGDSFSKKVF